VPTTWETTVIPQDKNKTNTTKNKHASLTKNTYNTKSTHIHTKIKPSLIASYDIPLGNGVRLIW